MFKTPEPGEDVKGTLMDPRITDPTKTSVDLVGTNAGGFEQKLPEAGLMGTGAASSANLEHFVDPKDGQPSPGQETGDEPSFGTGRPVSPTERVGEDYIMPPVSQHGTEPERVPPPTKETGPEKPVYDPNAAENYMDDDTTVEGRLRGLLASENPYIAMARSSAQQRMNSQGLQNSTMAGQAGEAAAIRAALPIAQQDAATAAEFRGREQVTKSQGWLNAQQHGFAMDQTRLQGAIQKELIGEQGRVNMLINEQQNAFNKWINTQNLEAAAKQNFSAQYAALSQTLATNIEYILRDEKLDAKAKQNAINLLTQRFQNDVSTMAELAGVGISWPKPKQPPVTGGGGGGGGKDTIEAGQWPMPPGQWEPVGSFEF